MLIRAADMDEALVKAQSELDKYVADSALDAVGKLHGFHMFSGPESGAEVFSLIRYSQLAAEQYVAHFFETGAEIEGGSGT